MAKSPGKLLYELAVQLEKDLKKCGRNVACVDLDPGTAVTPIALQDDKGLRVDVGFSLNPMRLIDTTTGQPLIGKKNGCVEGWEARCTLRISKCFSQSPMDCCHENTDHTYSFFNDLLVVNDSLFRWLIASNQYKQIDTQYVSSGQSGTITVNINFSMVVCMPTCEELIAEEAEMQGVLSGLKKENNC